MTSSHNKKYTPGAIPANEAERLQDLKSLDVLDTPNDPFLDDLTLLVQEICQTPIALVSIVDADRQWFKSKQGLDASETPRDVAFCGHAINGSEIFIVPDAHIDPRFNQNPLVTGDPKVRFYAGAPLKTDRGFTIGTLCAIDHVPRQLTEKQLQALSVLSRQVTAILERKRLEILIRDRTKQMEVALFRAIESEESQKALIDNSPIGIVHVSANGQLAFVNQAFCNFLGYSESELKSLTVFDITHPLDLEATHDLFNTQRTPGELIPKSEKRYRHRNGQTLWGLVTRRVIAALGGDRYYFVATVENITEAKANAEELKDAQAKLISSAKMASLGEMAGGIAHEINNPLAIIKGKSDLLLKQFSRGELNIEKANNSIQLIRNTADRIAKIVAGLRSFSRTGDADPMVYTEIAAVIEGTFELCRERFANNGILLTVNNPDNPAINCRPTQISQILMNLIGNAFDAVIALPEKKVHVDVTVDLSSVLLRVSDSGQGIPAEVVEKMMNPFFTTKEVGKGTGLGLSISKGIAESHSGTLTYELRNGHTSFVLTLPLAVK